MVQPNGLGEVADGGLVILQVSLDDPAHQVAARQALVQLNGLCGIGQAFLKSAHPVVDHGPAQIPGREFRMKRENLRKIGEGLGQAVLGQEDLAPLVKSAQFSGSRRRAS